MKLRDYYRKTVELNDSLTGGWGPIYYGIFSKIIEANNYKKIAEVGIGYGTHAKYVLKYNQNIEKLYLIDPMKYYPNDGFVTDILNQESSDHFEEMTELIKTELSPWSNKYTWFRTESLAITQDQIPDNSLDCVFVDGDHSFAAVIQDLSFWWAKIRVGGQLVGDDYWMDDVKKAVTLFSKKINIPVDFVSKNNSDYKIFRFKKI